MCNKISPGVKAQSFISVDRHLQHHIPSVRRSFKTVHLQTLLLNTDPVDTIINQIIILWSANTYIALGRIKVSQPAKPRERNVETERFTFTD